MYVVGPGGKVNPATLMSVDDQFVGTPTGFISVDGGTQF